MIWECRDIVVQAGELDARRKGVRDPNRREARVHQAEGKAGGVFAHGDVCAGATPTPLAGGSLFIPQ